MGKVFLGIFQENIFLGGKRFPGTFPVIFPGIFLGKLSQLLKDLLENIFPGKIGNIPGNIPSTGKSFPTFPGNIPRNVPGKCSQFFPGKSFPSFSQETGNISQEIFPGIFPSVPRKEHTAKIAFLV